MKVSKSPFAHLFYSPQDDSAGGAATVAHVGPKTQEFGKRFRPPPEIAAKHNLPDNKSDDVLAVEEIEKLEAPKPAEGSPGEQEGKKTLAPPKKAGGGFVKQQIEAKNAAEKERDEARQRLDKFEKEEVPSLQKQIQDLQAKIDSGKLSEAKEQEFQSKLEALVNEKDEAVKKLTEDLTSTRKRLSLYNLIEDPSYVERYLVPVQAVQNQMASMIASNEAALNTLHRAMLANQQALSTNDPKQRAEMEGERDRLIEAIVEPMGTVSQGRFTEAYNRWLVKTEEQALSLREHEKTAAELRKETQERVQSSVETEVKKWQSAFQGAGDVVKSDFDLSDDIKSQIKDAGIDLDKELAQVSEDVNQIISAKPDIKRSVQALHYARAYPVLKARISVMEKVISEQAETIKKLQGSGSRSDGSETELKPGEKTAEGQPTNERGETRTEWQKRFSQR